MIKLDIQMFAEGEPQEEQVDVTATQEVETQPEATPEPRSDVPTFATIDDYNKHVQSVSSKAKGELLKEIGLEKVADIKEAIAKGQSLKEITDELELTKSEREALKTELDTLKADKVKADNDKLIASLGIDSEYGDLFLNLVAGDTSDLPIEEKAIKVKETLAKMVGVTPKAGTDKTPSITEKELTNKLMADLQKL